MVRAKVLKLVLDDHGSYLGMEKGCFIVKDKHGTVERYPLFEKEIGEVVLKSGNMVSTGALASLGFWDIDVLVMTQRGRPVAMLKSLEDDSHVKTRLCQYPAEHCVRDPTPARCIAVWCPGCHPASTRRSTCL